MTLCTEVLRCRAIELIAESVSIIGVPDVVVTDTQDVTIRLRNVSAVTTHAYCAYVPDACSPATDFDVQIPALTTIEWSVRDGSPLVPFNVPAVGTLPFSGQLFCVQTDGGERSLSSNDLTAWSAEDGECPEPAVGIVAFSSNNGDQNLVFGAEFGPCPDELGSGFMENCWGNAPNFDFICP